MKTSAKYLHLTQGWGTYLLSWAASIVVYCWRATNNNLVS